MFNRIYVLIVFFVPLLSTPFTSAMAFFGTIVTPFEFRVRMMSGDKPLAGYTIALHDGRPGAEPYWPWKNKFKTDKDGYTDKVEFSAHGSVTLLTKRVTEKRILMALGPSNGQAEFRALDIDIGALTTSVKVKQSINLQDGPFKLISRLNESDIIKADWPIVTAVATKANFKEQAGWTVDLVVDLGERYQDYQ